jgi:hypothetical protein
MFTLISLPFACDARAESLSEEIDEIHQVDDELATLGGVARAPKLAGRAARLKQGAIDHAIVEYGIDIGALPAGVHYSPHGNMREREGATFLDRDGTLRVVIGDKAFRSPAWLGSTIAHEVEVHVNRQIAKGRRASASDEEGTSIEEVEAYDFELANQARFGMHADEGKLVRQRRMAFYRTLQYENRRRVDAGVYARP